MKQKNILKLTAAAAIIGAGYLRELFGISYGRQLGVSIPLGMDAALEKDYSQYAELAKKKMAECKLIDGSVDRVEYNC